MVRELCIRLRSCDSQAMARSARSPAVGASSRNGSFENSHLSSKGLLDSVFSGTWKNWLESPKFARAWPVLGYCMPVIGASTHTLASWGQLMQSKEPQTRSPQARIPVLVALTIPFPLWTSVVPSVNEMVSFKMGWQFLLQGIHWQLQERRETPLPALARSRLPFYLFCMVVPHL